MEVSSRKKWIIQCVTGLRKLYWLIISSRRKFRWLVKNGSASEISLIATKACLLVNVLESIWIFHCSRCKFVLRWTDGLTDEHTHASTSDIRSSLLGKISDRSTRVKDLPRDWSLDSKCCGEKGERRCFKSGSQFVNAPHTHRHTHTLVFPSWDTSETVLLLDVKGWPTFIPSTLYRRLHKVSFSNFWPWKNSYISSNVVLPFCNKTVI